MSEIIFVPSRDAHRADNRNSKLFTPRTSIRATRHQNFAVFSSPLSLVGRTRRSCLTNRQFIFHLFLLSEHSSTNASRIREDLLRLGGICSSRIHGVPRLSLRSQTADHSVRFTQPAALHAAHAENNLLRTIHVSPLLGSKVTRLCVRIHRSVAITHR